LFLKNGKKSRTDRQAGLETFLKQEWQQISRNIYLNLIDSMPRRTEECIAKNG